MKERIQIINGHPQRRFRKNPFERLARAVLKGEGKKAGDLTIVFVGDKEMRRLNRHFLNHQGTTDVISFPLNEEKEIEGEVYVNLDQATRQARDYNESVRDELKRLVIHGILHLIGYDDNSRTKKRLMHSVENTYLQWTNR